MWETMGGGHRSWMRIGTPFVRPFSEGVEGAEWENLYYQHVELHKAVNLEKPGISEKAKTLWSMRDSKTHGEAHNDRGSERQIESRTSVRRALRETHMKNPTAALVEALRRKMAHDGLSHRKWKRNVSAQSVFSEPVGAPSFVAV